MVSRVSTTVCKPNQQVLQENTKNITYMTDRFIMTDRSTGKQETSHGLPRFSPSLAAFHYCLFLSADQQRQGFAAETLMAAQRRVPIGVRKKRVCLLAHLRRHEASFLSYDTEQSGCNHAWHGSLHDRPRNARYGMLSVVR